MDSILPTADDVIEVVKELIAKDGVAAFETNGRVQLYSGPLAFITTALKVINNHRRAFAQAGNEACLIDRTKVGQLMDTLNAGQGVFAYFRSAYAPDITAGRYHADKVMRFTSSEFVKACYGNVETAVCGSDLGRIFYEVELPELIQNNRIEAINDRPAQRIRDTYFTQGAYVAYRKICKDELSLIRRKIAQGFTGTSPKDLHERTLFFQNESLHSFNLRCHNDKDTLTRLGPIAPRLDSKDPISLYPVSRSYRAKTVQIG